MPPSVRLQAIRPARALLQAPAHPDSVRRLAAIALFTLALLHLTGCALLRPEPLQVPERLLAGPLATQLTSEQTRQAAYARLYPGLENIQAVGELTGSGRLGLGKEQFNIFYFSNAQDQAPAPRPMRLRGQKLGENLFDVLILNDQMHVFMHKPQKLIFSGPIPPTGTPFAKSFGVEPWELLPILTIGHQIAAGQFNAETSPKGTTLYPASQTGGGIERIKLDARSGLPRTLIWRQGKKKIEVRYMAWQDFTGAAEAAPSRLMPARIEVRSKRPRINLDIEIERYLFDITVKPQMFNPNFGPGFQSFPLERLSEVLGN